MPVPPSREKNTVDAGDQNSVRRETIPVAVAEQTNRLRNILAELLKLRLQTVVV